MPILSWSALVFGSMATEMTGSGNSIFSSTIGRFSRQRLAGEGILQAQRGGDIARVHRPRLRGGRRTCAPRARCALCALGGVEHHRAGLYHARIDAEERQPSHVRIGDDLEDQRRQRLDRRGWRSISSPCCGFVPRTGGISSGDGSRSTTASSSNCTPLLRSAEPHNTGCTVPANGRRTQCCSSSSSLIGSSLRYFSVSASSSRRSPRSVCRAPSRPRRGCWRGWDGAQWPCPDRRRR
ncbi:MAG: hypothetical protein KatS3mg051_0375 [Anaerolineae bacterium]|nr:MAG: hypothetical protein KatS3mg051_0375 [Anaerolineae bacterium]